MLKNRKYNLGKKKDHNSELLLKILDKALIENKKDNNGELYLDENWKICAKDTIDKVSNDNSKLIKIMSELFPDKEIKVTNNKNKTQTILII